MEQSLRSHGEQEAGSREQETVPASRSTLAEYFFLILICLAFFVPGLFALPPVDRDESRFAQATSQMIETGDFVQIRFQDEPRNKKPIGIYWLQAASAALFETPQSRKIWPYRIPSLLGAIFSVLLTFALGKRLFGDRTGFLGAVLVASSLLLVMEAHLATTDAVLLATVMAAQGALSRFYIRDSENQSQKIGAFLTFWTAQAIGILVKGPVTPMISLFTICCLTAADRDAKWLKSMKPLLGLAITAILVSPWMIAIALATKGTFFQQALVGDMLSKVASGQESHGFPPGFYLLLMPLTLWPASAMAGVSIFRAWNSRSAPAVRFCLAWIIPGWIVFELIPTKLPHYVLPLYPALCLLIAHTIISSEEGDSREPASWLVKTMYASCQLVIMLLGLGALALPWFLEHRFEPVGLVPATAAVAATVLSTWKFCKRRYVHAAAVTIAATALVVAPSLQWILPNVNWLWLSRNVANAAKQSGGENVMLCSSGYHEPSLVFQLGTRTLLTSPGGAAACLRRITGSMALIDRSQDDDFKRETKNLGLHVKPAGAFYGFNYSKGRIMLLRLYVVDE
ncbi:MAG: glycosyltransferase family 39 protein [Syntrophobacteraceae bacterium]|jgi:4-amino-4-deoxy-L-arabinose transferase-like glycosyltransferase